MEVGGRDELEVGVSCVSLVMLAFASLADSGCDLISVFVVVSSLNNVPEWGSIVHPGGNRQRCTGQYQRFAETRR